MVTLYPNKSSVAVIGSSPPLLIEATYWAKLGYEVVVLEQEDRLGGAWGGTTVLDIEGIDIGSHDAPIHKINAAFLGKYFGIKFIQVGKEDDEETFLPSGGCAKLPKQLAKHAERCGVHIKMNCKVDRLELNQDIFTLQCTEKANNADQRIMITANKVVISFHSNIQISIDNKEMEVYLATETKHHLYFIVKGKFPDEYMIKLEDKSGIEFVRRVSNLTSLVSNLGNDQHLLVAEVWAKDKPSNDENQIGNMCNLIVEKLKKLGVLQRKVALGKYTYSTYRRACNSIMGDVKRIKEITLIHTNLINDMKEHLPRWKGALEPIADDSDEKSA